MGRNRTILLYFLNIKKENGGTRFNIFLKYQESTTHHKHKAMKEQF